MGSSAADRLAERIVVLRAQSGDRAAFHELVTMYEARLMYYVRRLGCDLDACQDVLQETWLQVFRSLGTLRAAEAFRVWLYRIAHRRAIEQVRLRTVEVPATNALAAEQADDNWNELALLENVEIVHQALERLSPAHREVLTLRFLEEMDVAEIAAVIGCSEGTAKSRLHYAKSALRALLETDAHV
ncbi:MAG: sigma-70 family RNA polymerase sigma factor [Singulisphaera sp.]